MPSPICCRVCDGLERDTQTRGIKRGGDDVRFVGAVGSVFIIVVVFGMGFLLGGTARIGGAAAEPPPYLPAVRPPVSRIPPQGLGRNFELVARSDYEGEPTHLFSLWRDPENPARVLAIQTFGGGGRREPEVDIRVVDLSGCPKTCTPHLAAKWGLPAQFSLGPSRPMSYPGTTHSLSLNTHEAVMSTDGKRI